MENEIGTCHLFIIIGNTERVNKPDDVKWRSMF